MAEKKKSLSLADLLGEEVDLTVLPDEDLEGRRQALAEAVDAAISSPTGITAEDAALMEAAQAQRQEIIDEQAERAEAAAELIARAEAVAAAIKEQDAVPEAEEAAAEDSDEVAAADEAADETAAADEAEAAEEATEESAADEGKDVSAAAKPKRALNRAVVVPARQRVPAQVAASTDEYRPKIVATGEVRGVASGTHLENMDQVDRAMFDKWVSLRQTADSHPHLMTTIDWRDSYGPEQTLMSGDPYEVSEKVNRYIAARHEGGEALNRLRVASGGVPGPAEPRYGQITFGTSDRPLRDSLPKFLAARGEIIFNGSPTLADVLLDTSAGAIGTVTSSADASGATKDIQEISAPTPTTVVVEAETMRWSQGNFADRFYPERTAAFMGLGQVAYARHNDALRLADIKTNCTKFTDTPAAYGAYRDLKRQFLGQTEELEDLVRDFNVPLHCLMPEYVPAMLAADMISQQAGDNVWNITEDSMRADVESWDPSVKITWMKDSIRGRLSTSPSGQSPRSAGFDADVEWCLFPDGAFLFLDGGQLDLGILRDTTVSATNKFQTFYESWEALAPLVSSTLCFWMTSSLCSDGNAQVAQNVGKCSAQNS